MFVIIHDSQATDRERVKYNRLVLDFHDNCVRLKTTIGTKKIVKLHILVQETESVHK